MGNDSPLTEAPKQTWCQRMKCSLGLHDRRGYEGVTFCWSCLHLLSGDEATLVRAIELARGEQERTARQMRGATAHGLCFENELAGEHIRSILMLSMLARVLQQLR